MGQGEARIKIPVRSRGWALKNKVHRLGRTISQDSLKQTITPPMSPNKELPYSASRGSLLVDCSEPQEEFYTVYRGNVASLNRFLLLSYFPSGFWPRLISRILSDDRVVEIVRNYFKTSSHFEITPEVRYTTVYPKLPAIYYYSLLTI